MKRAIYLAVTFIFVSGITLFNSSLFAQEPISEPLLEIYSISHGGHSSATSAGLKATLADQFFANGTAQAKITFRTEPNASCLFLRVWRKVAPDEIVFALLVDRVEVRGYDSTDTLVYSRDLGGFVFGDSQAGRWSRTLRDLPANVQRIQISYFGNYE